MERIASGLAYPKVRSSPPTAGMYWSQLGGGSVRRIDDGAGTLVASPGGAPNGAAVDRSGRIVVCNNGGKHLRPRRPADGPAPTTARRCRWWPGRRDRIDAPHRDRWGAPERPERHLPRSPRGLLVHRPLLGVPGRRDGRARHRLLRALTGGRRACNGAAVPERARARPRVHLAVRHRVLDGRRLGLPGGAARRPRRTGALRAVGLRRCPTVWPSTEPAACSSPVRAPGTCTCSAPTGSHGPVAMGVEDGLSNVCFGGPDLTTLFVTAAATGEVYRRRGAGSRTTGLALDGSTKRTGRSLTGRP